MKYFVKIARRKTISGLPPNFQTGLTYGAIAGGASVISTHPAEHKLYGKGKTFWGHMGARIGKGILASAVGFGTYHYLSHNEKKINNWLKRVRKSRSRILFKQF